MFLEINAARFFDAWESAGSVLQILTEFRCLNDKKIGQLFVANTSKA